MIEGWTNDEYLILFDDDEALRASERYKIEELIPGMTVVGLLGWDEFILRDTQGAAFTTPTVPAIAAEMRPYEIPENAMLTPDPELARKIKWYVQPVVFGGDPEPGDNLTWVSHEQHGKLVVWWNGKYREITAQRPIT